MNRVRFFADAALRQTIQDNCVPFAFNGLNSSGYATEDAFWKKLKLQLGGQGVVCYFLCTADGKVLGQVNGVGGHAAARRDLDTALAAWKKRPDAERMPGAVQVEDRGPFDSKKGVQPPAGGLILRQHFRGLEHDRAGKLYAPEKMTFFKNPTGPTTLADANSDFVWLTRTEWKSLVPATPEQGDRFPVPASMRSRVVRYHLRDAAYNVGRPWDAKDMHAAELTLTVEDVSTKRIHLRLDGSVLLAKGEDPKTASTGFDVSLLGFLSYDRVTDRFDRFDIVAVGEYWGRFGEASKAAGGFTPGPYRYHVGISFELVRGDTAMDRLPPFHASRAVGSDYCPSDK